MHTNKNKNKNKTSKITKDYLEGRYSTTTEERVQRWLVENENSQEKDRGSLEYWNTIQTTSDSTTYSALKPVLAKIGTPTTTHTTTKQTITLHRHLMRIAAVIIPALILLSGAYYLSQRAQIIEVVTAYGETTQIILPDSSQVWLNSGSSIEYPSEFKNNSRNLTLAGEAYFSIRKNSSKPFTVTTTNLSVNVLGTEFNVKAYANDPKTIATLASGKIEVKTVSNQSEILEPGEQLIYNNMTSDIQVQEVHSNDMSAWKGGQLVFLNSSFEDILKTLERHFNVSFESPNNESSTETYTIKFLKNDKLEDILNILEDVIGGFSYQIEDNVIKIKNM